MVPGVRKRSSKDVRASKANGRRGHAALSGAFKFEAELPPLSSGAR